MAIGKTKRKTSLQTSAPVATRRPSHGGCLQTGNPGNKGGGRRPDEVRQLAAQLSYDQIIPKLQELINNPATPPKTVVTACAAILGLVPRKDEGTFTAEQVKALCQAYASNVLAIVAEEAPSKFAAIQARVDRVLAIAV